MLLQIRRRTAESRVLLDAPVLEVSLDPTLQSLHPRRAFFLVQLQPLLRVELRRACLGVDFIDLAEGLEHKAHLFGKALGQLNELSPAVCVAVCQEGLEDPRRIVGGSVAHLDRCGQLRRASLQELLEVLTRMACAGEEERHAYALAYRDEPGGEDSGAPLTDILTEGCGALFGRQLQNPHPGVVLEEDLSLRALPDQLQKDRFRLVSRVGENVPLG